MNRLIFTGILCCLLVFTFSTGLAQGIQDYTNALRLSTPNLTLSARSLGMGGVWTGTANDFSAMFTNPAGLGQVRSNEVSFGLSNTAFDENSSFFGNSSSFSNSSTNINNLSLVYPIETMRGSMVIGVGYNRNSDFTGALAFNGFNPVSSIIPVLGNVGYQLYLADSNYNTPFTKNLQQQGTVLESGGVNNWTVSGAIETAPDLYLGLSLTLISGSYQYNRNYSESDTRGFYTGRFDIDSAFYQLNLVDAINDDISGFTAKLGLMYKPSPVSRIGVSVKIPTFYSIQETYSTYGTSYYATSTNTYGTGDLTAQYDVHTPFVFNAGFSYAFGDLMLAGDVDYTDWTQMSFENSDDLIAQQQENTNIKTYLRSTLNLRGGAEYEFPIIGLRLRAGYAFLPSPYEGDDASYSQKYITGGIGYIIQNAVSIDVAYAQGSWKMIPANYTDINGKVTSYTNEDVKTHTVIGTVSYRF